MMSAQLEISQTMLDPIYLRYREEYVEEMYRRNCCCTSVIEVMELSFQFQEYERRKTLELGSELQRRNFSDL